MVKYLTHVSCDAETFRQLEGIYSILKYKLEPCEIWERNQHRGVANFTISFQFDGLPEKGLPDSEGGLNRMKNKNTAIEEAKLFIAWLSMATRSPLDLSHIRFGGYQGFGPSSHDLLEEFDCDIIKRVYHLKESVKEGTYEKIKRPNYESSRFSARSLRIPHDFPQLSKKLYSLRKDYREKFFDSCLSYQYALINSGTIPSISLVALVNAVESLMRDRDTSGYCEETGKSCSAKRDITKKFRMFFEENLQYPLPDEKRRFLNDVYDNRSNFVHNALMGSGPFRGPIYLGLGGERELDDQFHEFETLLNVAMINWLIRV